MRPIQTHIEDLALAVAELGAMGCTVLDAQVDVWSGARAVIDGATADGLVAALDARGHGFVVGTVDGWFRCQAHVRGVRVLWYRRVSNGVG